VLLSWNQSATNYGYIPRKENRLFQLNNVVVNGSISQRFTTEYEHFAISHFITHEIHYRFLQDPMEMILWKGGEVLNHDNKVECGLNIEDLMVTIQ
jgi:hypothetical protein